MEVQVQDGTPNRKVYTITEKGRTAFVEGLKTPVEFERQKHPLLTRIFFFRFLSSQDRVSIMENYLRSVEKMQHEIEALRPHLPQHADQYQRLCLEFGIRFMRDLAANTAWLLETIQAESDASE